VLELRPTTFGTSPLSKGWGRPEAEINPQGQNNSKSTQDSRQDSSQYKHFLVTCFILFNKLLVYPIYDYQFWSFDTSEHWSFEPDRHQQKKKSSTRANSATTVKIHTIEDISRAQQSDDGEKSSQLKTSPEPSSATTVKSSQPTIKAITRA
jgi:hypothetical protein